jgi:hypothetical protein
MKAFLKVILILSIVLLMFGCAVTDSGGSGGSSSGDSESTDNSGSDSSSSAGTNSSSGSGSSSTTEETGTGTVSGTVNDDAEVKITQTDGTTQTATTSDEDPDYVFEDVPEGEATIEITTDDGTSTQVIEVVDGEETQVNPFGSTTEMDVSLAVKVYEVKNKGWRTTTANFLLDNQLGDEFFTKEINVPTRAFDEGFPGITNRFEWFGLIYEGTIKAPATGTYTFKITSDDGAYLAIDGVKVVNDDSVHAPRSKSGTIDLVEGEEYSFELKYFQGPRYHIALVLETQIPGEAKKLFNMTDFD